MTGRFVRRAVLWHLVRAGACVTAACVTAACDGHPGEPEARALAAQLDRLLPAGTALPRALVVLDSLGIERGGYDAASGEVQGILRDVGRTASTRAAVQVTLRFDVGDALRAHRVEVVLTGP